MKKSLLYIFSLLAFMLGLAQEDTLSRIQNVDSVIKQKKIIQIDIYVDYGKAAMAFSNFESKYAGGANLTFFSHYMITGEYGIATLTPDNAYENVDYTAEGSFYKVGIGYIGKFKETYKMGIGFRYGVSQFEDRGTINIISDTPLVDSYSDSFRRDNLESNWIEVFFLSETQLRLKKSDPNSYLNKLFSAGFSFQVRRMLEYTSFSPIDVYNIPGYGRSIDNSIPAVNVYLKVHLVR